TSAVPAPFRTVRVSTPSTPSAASGRSSASVAPTLSTGCAALAFSHWIDAFWTSGGTVSFTTLPAVSLSVTLQAPFSIVTFPVSLAAEELGFVREVPAGVAGAAGGVAGAGASCPEALPTIPRTKHAHVELEKNRIDDFPC